MREITYGAGGDGGIYSAPELLYTHVNIMQEIRRLLRAYRIAESLLGNTICNTRLLTPAHSCTSTSN